MELRKMNNKGFFGFIGMLLAVAFICYLAYFVYKQYYGKSTGMVQNIQAMFHQAGVDTTNQTSAIDYARSTVNAVEEAASQEEDLYNKAKQ